MNRNQANFFWNWNFSLRRCKNGSTIGSFSYESKKNRQASNSPWEHVLKHCQNQKKKDGQNQSKTSRCQGNMSWKRVLGVWISQVSSTRWIRKTWKLACSYALFWNVLPETIPSIPTEYQLLLLPLPKHHRYTKRSQHEDNVSDTMKRSQHDDCRFKLTVHMTRLGIATILK